MIYLDTLDKHFRNQIIDAGLTALIGANGSPLDVIGQITLPVKIGNFQSDQVFIVVRTLTVDCLLGADYLVAHEVVINYTLVTHLPIHPPFLMLICHNVNCLLFNNRNY